jgi:uncharacterized protein (DUF488 family)
MSNTTLYTVGHSNQSMEHFVQLLSQYQIRVLVDVRSAPYSKYASQFDKHALQASLTALEVRYCYLGRELGGRPDSADFYDGVGNVLYDKLAESQIFLTGIAVLKNEVVQQTVAVMCSEEDPGKCHRHLLISRVLSRQEFTVLHIRGDGSLISETDLEAYEQSARQPSLFGDTEDPAHN